MLPTAEDLSEKIGRPLKTGDVLIWRSSNPYRIEERHFEVINPDVEFRNKRLFSSEIIKPGIVIRRLTPHGPISDTTVVPRDENVWRAIVREEDRTDRPSLRER